MEKQYFSYIRVSTARQGERGVSLQEQQDAISRYAQKNGIRISRSFEERETAAKRGRPIFLPYGSITAARYSARRGDSQD